MKLFLFVLDLVGFLAVSISAVLASSVVSLFRWILGSSVELASKLARVLRRLKVKQLEFMKAEKNGTKWYRLRIGRWSLMLGRRVND